MLSAKRPFFDMFPRLATPSDPMIDPTPISDSKQYALLGNQCLVYGVFIYVLLLIPNSAAARAAILCCGTLLAGSGTVLKTIGRRLGAREAEARGAIGQAV